MANEIVTTAQDRMKQSLGSLQRDLGHIRAGRANASLLDRVQVVYYGAPTPLNQLASITIPEARVLMVTPFDKSILKDIEKALYESDLGITPANDGSVIRLVIPMLTEAPSSTDDMFEIAERKAVEAGLVQSGDDIVIVAGVPLGEAVRTNTMRIRTVRYLESPAVGPQNHIRCKQATFALNLFALLKTVPEFLWDLLLLCTFYIKTAFSGNANRIPIAENIVVNLICINDIRAGCKLLPVFCQFNHPKLKGKLWSYHTQCIYYSFQSSGANQGQRLCTLCVTHS